VCVFVSSLIYSARKTHAPYYIVICGLSGSTKLFHIISRMSRLQVRKLFNIKCGFLFSLWLLSERFLILRRIRRGTIMKVHRLLNQLLVMFVRF